MPPPDSNQLQKAIASVVGKIGRYKGAPFNEQDTKAALIEPILEALGWDTRDPEQVRREFRTNPKDNPVDYALLHTRQPRLMVEAKGLGETLDEQRWIGQILGYAAVGGARWCVLTNGEDYRIYNAVAPVSAAEKLLYKLRLTSEPPEESARLLSLLSRANLGENRIETLWQTQHIDRKVAAVLLDLFATPDKRLAAIIQSKDLGLTSKDVLASLRRLTIRVEQQPLHHSAAPTHAPPLRQQASPPAKATIKAGKKRGEKKRVFGVDLASLIGAGLLIPPLRLYRRYKGRTLEATLQPDGQVEFGGETYRTCSTAAEQARASVTGRRMNTNGWVFWQFDSGGGVPKTLETVRNRFLTGGGSSPA